MLKLKILHLECLPPDAGLTAHALSNITTAFELLVVNNKASYIDALTVFMPDVILADHYLSSFSADDAFQLLKQKDFKTPFIVVAAPFSEDFAISLMQQGAADYVLTDRLSRLPFAILNAVKRDNPKALNAGELQNGTTEIRSEDALKRSEANLSAIIENTSDLVYSLDKDLHFITFNQIFKDTIKAVYGFEVNQGDSILTLINNFDTVIADKWKSVYAKAINGETVQFVNEYNFGDDTVYLSYSVNPIRESGNVIGLSCFSRNITRQKLDEIALKKSEASLRTIFDNTEMAYLLMDADLRILSFNTLAQTFSQEQNNRTLTESNTAFDYFNEERWAFINDILNKAKKGEPANYQISKEVDGILRWYDINWACIKHQDSENLGYLLTNREVTDKKKSEIEREKITADLLKRNKDLEQFTYIISHNLRAPLTNIIGLSSLLDSMEFEGESLEILNGITLSANKLDGVISDLNQVLQVSHLNENNEQVSLPLLIGDIEKSIAYLVEKEQVRITCDFEEAAAMFTLKSYLHSVFYNLILNSIKYRKLNLAPIINIKSTVDGGKINISYTDNGRGIDIVKNKDDLFGLYKRFDTSVEGKGMGLFMVKMQVESLGGSISLQSEINKGTHFELEFPVNNMETFATAN